MKTNYQIIIAGSGGQGIVATGQMLAEAAILDGKNVTQTQSYGIAQRGGFCSAEVVIDDNEILYQQVETPDIIVVLSEDAEQRFRTTTAPVLYDNSVLQDISRDGWTGLPFSTLAAEAGTTKATNSVAVGALLALLPTITPAAFAQTLGRFKGRVQEQNLKAFSLGLEAGAALAKTKGVQS